MQDKQPKTQRRLMEEFPEINADVAENIDIKTKAKVLTYQSDNVNRDVSIVLQEEIKNVLRLRILEKLVRNVINLQVNIWKIIGFGFYKKTGIVYWLISYQ